MYLISLLTGLNYFVVMSMRVSRSNDFALTISADNLICRYDILVRPTLAKNSIAICSRPSGYHLRQKILHLKKTLSLTALNTLVMGLSQSAMMGK
jgi:hypothetical protein